MLNPATHLLPYQVAWSQCPARMAIGEKSRRIGWTYASAYRAVERRLMLESDLFYSSADLSAAREFIEYCEVFARAFKATARYMGNRVIDEREGISAHVLRFGNGARIVAGSSNPKFFRSKGGDADADEFAFHDDPRALFKAMHATAMVWGHQLRVWSTHNGEMSYFNRQCGGARGRDCGLRIPDCGLEEGGDSGLRIAGRGLEPGAGHVGSIAEAQTPQSAIRNPQSAIPLQSATCLHRVTIFDAVNQGLVERIKGLSAPDLTARRDWLEELRASCPDEDTWREEYLCQPSSEQSALLTYDMIGACEAREEIADLGLRIADSADAQSAVPDPGSPIRNPDSTIRNSLYAGFDVGRKRDRSVLWVLERVGDVYHTRGVRVLEAMPFSRQEDLLHLLLRDPAVKRLCVDSTGIGAMLAERLKQRWRHRVEGVHFTPASKSELAMPLVRLFQDRLVRVPADAATREDLHKVRRTVTAAGNVRFDAARDENGHADRFWALALAYHAAEHAPARLFTLARKPVGW